MKSPLLLSLLALGTLLPGCSDAPAASIAEAQAADTSDTDAVLAAPAEDAATASEAESGAATDDVPSTAPLAPFQERLLDVAFDAASKFPLEPHVKNRSRAQEEIVDTAIELGDLERAERYADGIANWRRGAAYASIAYEHARRGDLEEAERLLALADEIMREMSPDELAWRRDRIRARIAMTHMELGHEDEAELYATELAETERTEIAAARADAVTEDALEAEISYVETLLETGNFEPVRLALGTSAKLYGRFYDDAESRALLEEVCTENWTPVPLQVRLEFLLELADAALAHGDAANARRLVAATTEALESAEWLAQDEVPLRTRIAVRRYRAGEREAALRDVDEALALYESQEFRIIDIWRAGALRPVAEAYVAMDEPEAARAAYARALEQAVINPNSRPRCDDLVATCCSIALEGFDPGPGLLARIASIADGLDHPW